MTEESRKQSGFKFNWGIGLTVVIILFIVGTLSMVGFIISLDFHMVTDNHYEKAVNYQDHIDRIEQTGELDQPVEILFHPENTEIQVRFPSSLVTENTTGTVELYRPDDSTKDQKIKLEPDSDGIHRIPTDRLVKGKWLVKVTWASNTGHYFKQKEILL